MNFNVVDVRDGGLRGTGVRMGANGRASTDLPMSRRLRRQFSRDFSSAAAAEHAQGQARPRG